MKKRRKPNTTHPAPEQPAAPAAPLPAPVDAPLSASTATISPVYEDFSSTPSRLETKVSDFWRFLGLFGACLLLAGVVMWSWNIYTLSSGAVEINAAQKAVEKAQDDQRAAMQRAQEQRNDQAMLDANQAAQKLKVAQVALSKANRERGTEPFRWVMIGIWSVLGYALLLVHATRERQSLVGRAYGLAGLGMIAFGAVYLAYAIGMHNHGTGLGLVCGGAVAFLTLGMFLWPLSNQREEDGADAAPSPVVQPALWGGLILALFLVLAYFAHDALRTYAEQVNRLKDTSILPYGLMPLGLLWLALGLGLTLIHSSQEAEKAWRHAVVWPVAMLGLTAALIGLGTVFTSWGGQEVLAVPYGLIFGVVGLLLLGMSLPGWEEGESRRNAALGLAGLGLVFFLVAVYRSAEPPILEHFAQRYDVPGFLVPHGFVLMVLSSLYMLVGLMVASDHRLIVMIRRELASLFYSPIAYICLAGLGLFGWLSYVTWVDNLARSQAMSVPEPIIQMYLQGFYIIIGLMVTLPMFTMRLISEERRSGTLEMTLTAPVSEAQVVLSKFFGVWLFSLVAFGIWMVFPLLLRVYGQEEFDYRPLLSFYLCLGCALAHFLAMGLFCSSITRSQIVAFLLSLAGMFLLLVPLFLARQLQAEMSMNRPVSQTALQTYLYLAYIHHLLETLEGRVHLMHLMFHLSASVFWLFVTMKVLEARKWQ